MKESPFYNVVFGPMFALKKSKNILIPTIPTVNFQTFVLNTDLLLAIGSRRVKDRRTFASMF